MNNIELNWRESLLRTRPTKVCDWADERANALFSDIQLMPGNPVGKICDAIAEALRAAYDKGLKAPRNMMDLAAQRTPQMDAELHEYAVEMAKRSHWAPRDVRQRLYELRRTIRDFDTQSDHDLERTEGWAAGEGAL